MGVWVSGRDKAAAQKRKQDEVEMTRQHSHDTYHKLWLSAFAVKAAKVSHLLIDFDEIYLATGFAIAFYTFSHLTIERWQTIETSRLNATVSRARDQGKISF